MWNEEVVVKDVKFVVLTFPYSYCVEHYRNVMTLLLVYAAEMRLAYLDTAADEFPQQFVNLKYDGRYELFTTSTQACEFG